MVRNKIVVGNWKMHGALQQNAALLSSLSTGLSGIACEVGVCVPFPYLGQASTLLEDSAIQLGAQNVSEHDVGAYTGEVSAAMLREFACKLVLVGHSERRTLFGETDDQVAAKFFAALSAGLTPVLCVGESLLEREAGATESVVRRQLQVIIDRIEPSLWREAIVAYEPVWAIGTGMTATPDQAQAVHRYIRSVIAQSDAAAAEGVQILYGGSVKAGNARDLFAQPDIDGGLIGGASLIAEDFMAICRAAV